MLEIVIIERAGNAVVIRCGSCKGSGESRHHIYCAACNGSGHVTIVCEDDGIPIVTCGSCGGKGESRHHNYCRSCGGCGAVPAYGRFEIRKAERQE